MAYFQHSIVKLLSHIGTTEPGTSADSPQLAIMALVCPPEGVLLQDLVLLEVSAHAPALVVGQRVAVLGEQGVDARDAPVPAVLQVLRRQFKARMHSHRDMCVPLHFCTHLHMQCPCHTCVSAPEKSSMSACEPHALTGLLPDSEHQVWQQAWGSSLQG